MKLLDLLLRTHNKKLCFCNIKPPTSSTVPQSCLYIGNLKRDLTLRLEETKIAKSLKSVFRKLGDRSTGLGHRSTGSVKKRLSKLHALGLAIIITSDRPVKGTDRPVFMFSLQYVFNFGADFLSLF